MISADKYNKNTTTKNADNNHNNMEGILQSIRRKSPKIHCITNPVTMQDVANILLAAGGSAIMARDPEEVSEITSICQGTLLNTGVPDERILQSCILAGTRAHTLRHSVVLDPVGVGASSFRRKMLRELLAQVSPDVIRCNQEEAFVLNSLLSPSEKISHPAGVESSLSFDRETLASLALKTASLYQCVILISGNEDVVSDGTQVRFLQGGDPRIRRITGGGCMLSALCALFACADAPLFESISTAGHMWKLASLEAGLRTDLHSGGIGSFHVHLFDTLERLIYERQAL